MDKQGTIVMAAATLISALAGVAVSLYFTRTFTTADLQRDVFERIAGWRFKLQPDQLACNGDEFFAALNEAEVVFHDDPEVRAALNELRANLGGDNDNVYVVKVLREMMIELDLNPPLDENALLKPFGPTGRRC